MGESSGPSPGSPADAVAMLVGLLDVEEIDTDLFRGRPLPEGRGRVFGGQVIAQALAAASQSVGADRTVHSLHAYFIRAGEEQRPIIYRVLRDHDGQSFATRRVIALQQGRPILNMAASFHVTEEGLTHQAEMPDVPPPEALEDDRALMRADAAAVPERFRFLLERPWPIEMRPVQPRSRFAPEKSPPCRQSWFRAAAALPDDPGLHRAVLAYASDMSLLGTCTLPHGLGWATGALRMASLDHALWLHEPFRVDEWLLYSTDSPWAGHARGFNRGLVFSRAGRLVASVAQEGLIRLRR